MLTLKNFTFGSQCVHLFCANIRTDIEVCCMQYSVTGCYNRNGRCLLRGTNWVFK